MSLSLSARERAHLKARAHSLEPIVHIGHDGLTDAVAREIDRALTAHELIKVRAGGDDRQARAALMDQICERLKAAPVQSVGKVLIIWRPRPVDDEADRPKGASESGAR
jgi:putative YhbY family RNA-binding protein